MGQDLRGLYVTIVKWYNFWQNKLIFIAFLDSKMKTKRCKINLFIYFSEYRIIFLLQYLFTHLSFLNKFPVFLSLFFLSLRVFVKSIHVSLYVSLFLRHLPLTKRVLLLKFNNGKIFSSINSL